MKRLNGITLLAADTTSKAHLAERALIRSLDRVQPDQVKLLTDNMSLRFAYQIPKLNGLGAYSKFCIRDMTKYVNTPFALVCQSDGYVLNGEAWTDGFLNWDYIGAPFNPSGVVGNGGFSLRSKRLMDYLACTSWDDFHPEDSAICVRHRAELEAAGFKIAPLEVAQKFAVEGRSWNGQEWMGTANRWNGQFGFHSWLTPGVPNAPKIFHHSGDMGDIIYSLPVIKAMGGGVLFVSPHNRFPYPLDSRWSRMGGNASAVDNIRPLLEAQHYIDRVAYTHGTPISTSYDLNRFRLPWKNRTARDFDSIKKLHCDAFNIEWPDSKPWLEIRNPISIPGKPIVVARSPRYHNDQFPWYELVQKFGNQMVFVGDESEARVFQGFGAPKHKIYWHQTSNMLELARVIAGASICVMNQSAPLAIAHGLCKPVVVEEWPGNPNCHLEREGAIYLPLGAALMPLKYLE